MIQKVIWILCSQTLTKDFNASQSAGFSADAIDEDCQNVGNIVSIENNRVLELSHVNAGASTSGGKQVLYDNILIEDNSWDENDFNK